MSRLAPWVLLSAVALAYTWRLGEMPTYLSPDEAIIAVDAHSLATTGRDVHGAPAPLYFFVQMPNSERTGWFTPMIFYVSALVQQLTPFSEWSVRLPSVLVGLANVALMLLLAREMFGNRMLAACAATLLALAPAHFIFSRYALDYLYPVPFLIAWLLAVLRAMRAPTPGRIAWCGAVLGAAFYSYAAAVLLTPMFLALTCIALTSSRADWKRSWPAVAAYAVMLVPFLVWFAQHPDAFGDTARRYAIYDTQSLNALQGIREFLGRPNIERMVSIYWSFLSPSFLFLSGDQMITFSTRQVGAFPWAVAVFVVLGFVQIVEHERNRTAALVVAGLLLAPLPAVVVPEAGAMNRATAMLPFVALVATYGVKYLWSLRTILLARPLARWGGAALALLGVAYAAWTLASDQRLGGSAVAIVGLGLGLAAFAATPATLRQGPVLAVGILTVTLVQFGGFSRDYFGDYRIRVSSWLGGNLRGALEAIIDRQPVDSGSRVYFAHLQATSGLADIRNYWMDAYWRFYLIKHQREDLLSRTGEFRPEAVDELPPGSLILGNLGDRVVEGLLTAGRLRAVATVPELDRDPYFVLLERAGS